MSIGLLKGQLTSVGPPAAISLQQVGVGETLAVRRLQIRLAHFIHEPVNVLSVRLKYYFVCKVGNFFLTKMGKFFFVITVWISIIKKR